MYIRKDIFDTFIKGRVGIYQSFKKQTFISNDVDVVITVKKFRFKFIFTKITTM